MTRAHRRARCGRACSAADVGQSIEGQALELLAFLLGGVLRLFEVKLLGLCRVALLLADLFVFHHEVEHQLLPFLVVFRKTEGVVFRRVFRDAGNGSALCQRQLRHLFAEIGLRRGRDAVAAIAKEDRVQI